MINLFGGGDGLSAEGIFVARHARDTKRAPVGKNTTRTLTLDVSADRLIVFTKDEGADLNKTDRAKVGALGDSGLSTPSTGDALCNYLQPGTIAALLLLLIASASAIIVQRCYYQRRLAAMNSLGDKYPVLASSGSLDSGFTPSGYELNALYGSCAHLPYTPRASYRVNTSPHITASGRRLPRFD